MSTTNVAEAGASLLKLLPVGTVLQFQGEDCRYKGWFTVALGGYSTLEVARFVHCGKDVYFSIDIADSQFGLPSMLDRIKSEPFGALNHDMQQFIVNHFNSQKGGAV